MEIDWKGILIALFVTFLTFFVLVKATDLTGICLKNKSSVTSACLSDLTAVLNFVPISLLIVFSRAFLIPVFSFTLGLLYYYKGYHIEKWTDVLLPGFIIGFIGGFVIFIALSILQAPIFFDMIYFYTLLSWFGFFIGTVVICSILGGLIVYATMKKK